MMRASGRTTALLALALAACAAAFAVQPARAADPLATYAFRVVGAELRVAPAVLSVPKGIAGSLAIDVVAADGSRNAATAALADGAVVEATLRGPSFPARRLVGAPDRPLVLPPLPLVGEYRLDDVRLVDVATGATRLAGTPRSVPIQVFAEVLVSRVTSRPLSIDEIQERGIAIDESSFQAVEFEVGFVVDGATVSVKFPVVSPRLVQSTEIVPRAEVEELLARAEQVNRELADAVELPPQLTASYLGFEAKPMNMQMVDPAGDADLALSVPPIPALLLIPGRIGLLNQFFSVQLFTQNAAPGGSGLSVYDLDARLVLPPGYDGVPGTPDAPGDDPVRFARLGPDRLVEPVQRLATVGPDGVAGTSDDGQRLFPGDTGQAEFLVEGLDEGLHVLDVELSGRLDGLAAGPVQITGRAAGSVLVRNPSFSMAFSHPRTIRAGEPYTASVTVLNTSPAPANLASVTLPGTALSGATFEPGSSERVELGTILPGATATAEWRLRAQRTGAITFSQLISDENLTGRFRLRMGVDERGVELSPDAIGWPEYVDDVEAAAPDVFAAANRVLGQALSVATAAVLPSNVRPIVRRTLERRVLELAEAGQRLRYGDAPERVWADLLLDWQGGRTQSDGFDQLLRETQAGREWREAIAAAQEAADAVDAAERLDARAVDLAGRGEVWQIAATSDANVEPAFVAGIASATLDTSAVAEVLGYRGARGHALALRTAAGGALRFEVVAATGGFEIAWLDLAADGTGRLLRWTVDGAAAGDCLRFAPLPGASTIELDAGCDGSVDASLVAVERDVVEAPPEVLSVFQDLDAKGGRPIPSCYREEPLNYATLIAVLFSKPVTQASAGSPAAYALDDGNFGKGVAIQPGGRVALVNLARPIGRIRPEPPATPRLRVVGASDPRGNPVVDDPKPVALVAEEGVAVRGLVAGADGAPAAGVPVTLTIHDQLLTFSADCADWTRRISQVFSDEQGRFAFDFVLSGIPYSVSATDTRGLSDATVELLVEASAGGDLDRGRLAQLADLDPGTLLAEFATGSLPQAVALAEGVDRALFRDLVPMGGRREGSEVPIALRFRGRAGVSGTVYAPDGVTPVAGAAVNLFPAPDSREQGRGILSDEFGRFAFAGVPLGAFTIEAESPTGLARTLSGALEVPGALAEVDVVLAAEFVARTTLRGRVLEGDRSTPHPGARVFVGVPGASGGGMLGNIVASVDADAQGRFEARDVPVGTWSVVAIAADGRRSGIANGVSLVEGADAFTDVLLPDRSELAVQVLFANGDPVVGALVAGGELLAETDAFGRATLLGVPTGIRTLGAGYRGDAAHPDPRRRTTRTTSATVDVVAGLPSVVTIPMPESGSIFGVVRDAAGNPRPREKVSVPLGPKNFVWTTADAQGRFTFPALPLGDYTVSAPSPPTAETDVTGILDTLAGSPNEEELLAAIGEAYAIFTGINDPLLNPQPFNPLQWGYTRVTLDADGVAKAADIDFLGVGNVRGTVLNGQGVPIGARVRLTGIGPSASGDVSTMIRGELNSDPATGLFSFLGQALIGSFGLQAASPFFPAVIAASGQITPIELDPPPVLLQFPPVREVNGRITGTVLDPGGNPVAGARVRIHTDRSCSAANESSCAIRITGADGRFGDESQLFNLPAFRDGGPASYFVEAIDEAGTQLVASAIATLTPAATTDLALRLLGRGGASIQVLQAGGTPAPGAAVRITGSAYPNQMLEGVADAEGRIRFGDAATGSFPLPQGRYAVEARFLDGAVAVQERRFVTVENGAIAATTVVLGPTASLHGRFFDTNGTTPIAFAQVRVGALAFAATDADGAFAVTGIPLGTHVVTGQDAVTGRYGSASVVLAQADEDREVNLRVRPSGELLGAVVSSEGNRYVPAASVTLRSDDGVTPERVVTTDPSGFFSFPGTPAGPFRLSASDPISDVAGSLQGSFPDGASSYRADVLLEPRASFTVRVFEPDGVTPAAARVAAGRVAALVIDTDLEGRATFAGMALATWPLRAESRDPAATRSVGVAEVRLTRSGPLDGEIAIVLSGVGSVDGRVFEADGVTPALGADLEILFEGPFHAGQSATPDVVEDGAFAFSNVPLGVFRVVARQGALGATATGVIAIDGSSESVDLVLGESGSVTGRVVDPAGQPVAGAQVVLGYTPQSAVADTTLAVSDEDGGFRFDAIPVGEISLSASDAASGGIRTLPLTGDDPLVLSSAGIDLGDVVLDTEPPAVASSDPSDTETGVPTDVVVEISMSEPLQRTADAGGIDATGVFLRQGASRVPAIAELDAADPTLVRVTPTEPLASEAVYELVVANGELRDALGAIIARGPRDLAGRPLRFPFTARFTTRDDDSPGLLSFTPASGAEQVDPSAVLRLSFDEPLDAAGIAVELRDEQGALVAGDVAVGVGAQVVVFTPTAFLAPNHVYTATVGGVRDVAGNLAEDQPFATNFATLDTFGPAITSLSLAPGAAPVAGATVEVLASLAAPETGASLRATVDFAPAGASPPGVLSLPVALPATPGMAVIRAVAIDRFGNEGPLAELGVSVVANQPPSIAFERLEPASGPVASGSRLRVRVSASDDGGIAELRASATGAASQAVTTSDGTPIEIDVAVPATAGAGANVTLRGEAIDDSAASSGEQVLIVPVSDGVAPVAAIGAPASGGTVDAGASFAVAVSASDAFGVTAIELATSGPVAGGGTRSVSATEISEIFEITVAAGAAARAPITLTAIARDAAGNASAPSAIALSVRDATLPSVVSVLPANGATGVPVATAIVLSFSEALDPATLTPASVRLDGPGGVPVAASLGLAAGDTLVTLTPTAPLAFDTAHAVRVETTVSDLSGNPLAAPFASVFTTAGDVAGPQLLELAPGDGALDVSIAPLLRARFDDAVARASLAGGAFEVRDLDAGDVPVPADLVFESEDRDVLLVPTAPLGFDRAYALVLGTGVLGADGNPIRGANGEPLDAPLVHAFRTSRFAITTPRDGRAVDENGTILLEAQASPALGVARVAFEVNGITASVVPAAPFQASFVVPSADAAASLVIRAIGRNETGDVVGTDEVTVAVQRALRVVPRILGVPVGDSRTLRLVLSGPAPADLPVSLAPVEPGVASAPAEVVIAAGEREALVEIEGLANGSTALVATSARGDAAAAVSVGTPVAGATLDLFEQIGAPVEGAAPGELHDVIGAVVQKAQTAGQLLVPDAGTRSVVIPILAAPAASALPVTITTSNAAVARVDAPASVAAGAQVASVEVVTGNDGVALLTFTAGGVSRVVTVVVGVPPAGVAAPLFEQVGAAVQRPTLQVWLDPGAVRTLALPLLPYPALFPASGTAVSRDFAVATVGPGGFAFGVGDPQTATLTITAGSEPGVTAIDVRLGDLHRAIEVVVGTPGDALIPDTRAPVTGVRVEP